MATDTGPAASTEMSPLESQLSADDFADLGVLLDHHHIEDDAVQTLEWELKEQQRSIQVQLRLTSKGSIEARNDDDDDDEQSHSSESTSPQQAVQFTAPGRALSPAAQYLADYLVHHLAVVDPDLKPKTVVELGAGAGLLALVALQLWQTSVETVVCTDARTAALEMARDNHETTLQTLLDRSVSDADLNAVINSTASIGFHVQKLRWGKDSDIKPVRSLLTATQRRADVILGSSLLPENGDNDIEEDEKAKDVLTRLLTTVKDLIAEDGVFWLALSSTTKPPPIKLRVLCAQLGLMHHVRVNHPDWTLHEFRLEGAVDYSTSSFEEGSHDGFHDEIDESIIPEEVNQEAP